VSDNDESKPSQAVVVNEKQLFPDTDITGRNAEKLQKYIDDGLPGIIAVDDAKYAKMVDMYLSNKTYDQIANATKTPKPMIMYLSQKYGWCASKQAYLMELEEGMKRRIIENKLVSQDFMIQLVQMWQKKIGKKMARYLATDNEEHLDGINLKEIDRYLKVVESLKESIQPPKSDNKAPTVGLNLGDGVTITKKGDNEVEITPKQKAIGDILQQYADLRRAEEKKK
jgi:hypothetical protein